MSVSQTINQLRQTTKRNEKIEILESIKGTDTEYLFKRVAFLTYDPSINFWHKEIEFTEPQDTTNSLFEEVCPTLNLDNALDHLQYDVSKRVVTGNKSLEMIKNLYATVEDENRDVIRCIIDRDLKCGVSAKTLNKVWPNLIYDHPYMRASSFNAKNVSKINFPCFSQTKEDGEYQDIIYDGNNISCFSRNGINNTNNHLSRELYSIIEDNLDAAVVLMGEILVFTDNTQTELMSREDGNGYLSSKEVDKDRLLYVLWDMVEYEDFKDGAASTPYKDRFHALKRFCGRVSTQTKQIRLIDSRVVNSIDEVIEHFKENATNGLEGTVIKNMNMQWKNGTSRDQVKIKIVFDCDLRIVGFNQGKEKGKYVEKLGSLQVKSSDGMVEFNVGTGFSDEQRAEIWENRVSYLKKIVTVKGNDIVESDLKPDKYAIFLSRYVKVRDDKNQPDSYERIKEQRDSFMETLKELES
ncbi:MAG: hypothetical protein R3230_00955 [Nitrosopumilaceae archaeon]|nr:hypothetical protein [Nitrosopumilaceae archaeon]